MPPQRGALPGTSSGADAAISFRERAAGRRRHSAAVRPRPSRVRRRLPSGPNEPPVSLSSPVMDTSSRRKIRTPLTGSESRMLFAE